MEGETAVEKVDGEPKVENAPVPVSTKPRETLFANPEEEEKTVRLLTESFLDTFHAPLEQISDKLAELKKSQEELLSSLNVEREKLESIPYLQQVSQTVSKIGPYQQKVLNLKKNMVSIRERVNKLQKRTEKLKEQKEKELEKERQLTAQPSKSLLEKTASQSSDKDVKKDKPPATASTTSSTPAASSSAQSTASSTTTLKTSAFKGQQ